MSKHSEIDKHEFKIIESEYGIKQETFLGSMQEEIKKYIINDKIKFIGKKITEEKIVEIKSNPKQGFFIAKKK